MFLSPAVFMLLLGDLLVGASSVLEAVDARPKSASGSKRSRWLPDPRPAAVTVNSNPTNQDTYVMEKVVDSLGREVRLFAVFDGHSGDHTSVYLKDKFPKKLQSVLTLTGNVEAALAVALEAIDEDYTKQFPAESLSIGSCALVVAVTSESLVVASLGDSAAIMVPKEGKVGDPTVFQQLNRQLSASNEEERRRILAEFPVEASFVCDVDFEWYLRKKGHELQPTRTVGDKFFSPIVKPIAEISSFPIPKGGARVVLASDGLWDMVTMAEVASLAGEAGDPSRAADRLLEETLEAAVKQANATDEPELTLAELRSRLGHESRKLMDDTTIIVFDLP